MIFAGTPPNASKAFTWQPRKCSMVCATVNSTYIMRLWQSTRTKKLNRRRVLPTLTEP